MEDKILATGNEAVGWGAIYAGCKGFFGYPITPQNEIPEFMSREMPKAGGIFIQSESEGASINMLYGGSAAGIRAMTSTSSPGFSLMQEGISSMCAANMPGVVVDVMRNGPGWGTTQTGQMDYRQVTKGGGHGGYRTIVLAPSSVQETFDLMQLAFHLADKYGIVVVVLSDAITGQMTELLELRTIDLGPLPEVTRPVAKTAAKKGGKRDVIFPSGGSVGGVVGLVKDLMEKNQKITEAEVRYQTSQTEDADLLLVAFGSTARVARGAVEMARAEGLKVGLFRPITLWPFPSRALKESVSSQGQILVVEDNEGQLIEDVQVAVGERVPVHLLGAWGRHITTGSGLFHPERILQEVKELL